MTMTAKHLVHTLHEIDLDTVWNQQLEKLVKAIADWTIVWTTNNAVKLKGLKRFPIPKFKIQNEEMFGVSSCLIQQKRLS